MNADELSAKMKQFAVDIIKICDVMPRKLSSQVIVKQLIRSATSVGANYREACYARSRAEFIAKVGICLQETNETLYWLEIVKEIELLPHPVLNPILQEADELLSILIASSKTANRKTGKG